MAAHVTIENGVIADFCRRHSIRRFSFFGSVLRDDFTPDSDVDVLVEFAPEAVVGFLSFHRIEKELSRLLGGRKVDMVTVGSLSPRLRDRILASAEVRYAQG